MRRAGSGARGAAAWRAIARHPAGVGLSLGAVVFVALFLLPPGGEARRVVAPERPRGQRDAVASGTLIVAADDVAQVFVDGRLAVRSETWASPARLVLPRSAKRVLVAVQARNERGPGGLIGAWRPPGGVTAPAEWTCGETPEPGWNQPTDDPGWPGAEPLTAYGGAPWGKPAGDDLAGAAWWWTRSPAGEDQTIYCRWWIPQWRTP